MILYQDDELVAVDKPEGVSTLPERDPRRPCVLHTLSEQLGEAPLVVHRLDKAVSGVLLFARHAGSHRWLNGLFARRRIRKQYVGVVHGRPSPPEGEIDLPIRQFGSGRMGVDPDRGKPSLTAYRLLETFAGHSLLELQPLTGRRHQLRVHLYQIGHPLVGDPLYGDRHDASGDLRLMLHAREVEFETANGRRLLITCPPPRSYEREIERLRDAGAGL